MISRVFSFLRRPSNQTSESSDFDILPPPSTEDISTPSTDDESDDIYFTEKAPIYHESNPLPECNCKGTDKAQTPFKVTSMKFNLNQKAVNNSIQLDEYRTNDLRSQYVASNQCSNLENTNWSNGITYEAFTTDTHFLAVDLSASGSSSDGVLSPRIRTGASSFSVTFNKPTTIPLDVVVVLELLSTMRIDKERAVSLDYSM
jgi:hypothetical protein